MLHCVYIMHGSLSLTRADKHIYITVKGLNWSYIYERSEWRAKLVMSEASYERNDSKNIWDIYTNNETMKVARIFFLWNNKLGETPQGRYILKGKCLKMCENRVLLSIWIILYFWHFFSISYSLLLLWTKYFPLWPLRPPPPPPTSQDFFLENLSVFSVFWGTS